MDREYPINRVFYEEDLKMYKEYMLKCDGWNPLDGVWENVTLFFDSEKEMKEYIKSQGKGIKVEAMFKLERIENN